MHINELLLKRSIFKDSYYEYIKHFWNVIEGQPFQHAPHIEYLAKEMQQILNWVADWESQGDDAYNLLVNVGPGSSKSTVMSKFATPYLWQLNHDKSIVTSAYSSGAVDTFTNAIKKLMTSNEYLEAYPELELSVDNMTMQKNKFKGRRETTSTGGTITSKHFDLINIDDPDKPPVIKLRRDGTQDLEQGATLTEILNGRAWFESTLSNRVTSEKYTRFAITQQRLHRMDLSGLLIEKARIGAMNLRHISLPSIITKLHKPEVKTYIDGKLEEVKDLSYLYENNLLNPKRHDEKVLERRKKIMGTFLFNAQNQQKPDKEGGGKIKTKWFPIIKRYEVPDNLVRFFYSDTSDGKKTSDNMATIVWSVHEGNMIVWEIFATKKEFADYMGHYADEKDPNSYVPKEYDFLVQRHLSNYQSLHFVEAKSTGSAYVSYMNRSTPYNAIPDVPVGSKSDRVNLSRGRWESGRVRFVEGDWIEEAFEEFRNFNGDDKDQDDRVDVLTGATKNTRFEGSIFIVPQDEAKKRKVYV